MINLAFSLHRRCAKSILEAPMYEVMRSMVCQRLASFVPYQRISNVEIMSLRSLKLDVKTSYSAVTRSLASLSQNVHADSTKSAQSDIPRMQASDGDTEVPEPDCLYHYIDIETRGHDMAVLNSYEVYVVSAAKQLNINISKIWCPRKVFWKKTVLKTHFVHKKHRSQYETRTHYRVIQLKYVTGSTAATFLEYIERNTPEGIGLKITKHLIEELPDNIKDVLSASLSA